MIIQLMKEKWGLELSRIEAGWHEILQLLQNVVDYLWRAAWLIEIYHSAVDMKILIQLCERNFQKIIERKPRSNKRSRGRVGT